MPLRDYQQQACDQTWAWLNANKEGNPILVLPTGAGKSHVVAELSRAAVEDWGARVLMLTHVKELVEQNAEKMRKAWPNAPLGIFSASLGRREATEPIVFGTVGSVHNALRAIGPRHLLIIDECHLVNHKNEGRYRQIMEQLGCRTVGLTATPWRTGHGSMLAEPTVWNELIEPTSIADLANRGFLCRLNSKNTDLNVSADGVSVRAGDFVEAELDRLVNTVENNTGAVAEIIRRGQDRRHWLVFAVSVDHARHLADQFKARGVAAGVVTGDMPKTERRETIEAFKRGDLRVVVNVNVLSTGFDFPGIDLIAFLRPTQSVVLYVQQAGRGLRPAEGKADCLVLDFVGNIKRNGDIFDPAFWRTVEQAGSGRSCDKESNRGDGVVPMRQCRFCHALNPINAFDCVECGRPTFEIALDDDADIMSPAGLGFSQMEPLGWRARVHFNRATGGSSIAITYYPRILNARPVVEFLSVNAAGGFGKMQRNQVRDIYRAIGRVPPGGVFDLERICIDLNAAPAPHRVWFKMRGRFFDVARRDWRQKHAKQSAPVDTAKPAEARRPEAPAPVLSQLSLLRE